jgi:hypothetical protein
LSLLLDNPLNPRGWFPLIEASRIFPRHGAILVQIAVPVTMIIDQPERGMDSNPLALVIQALERAALQSTVLPYKRFHVLFPRTVPLTRRYEVLDAALRSLNNAPDIDYGVMLACDNGLPGPEFFRRYQKQRWETYVAVMGDPRFKSATLKGKRELVAAERQRVHQHALRTRAQGRALEREQEHEQQCA